MAWKSGGPSRTSTAAWRAVRRLARKVLPYECARCGIDGRDVPLELDHVVPVSEGGADDIGNAQWLCPSCHTPKTQAEAKRGRERRKRSGRRPPRVHPSDVLLGP
ncbi:HNH endonuclease [Mycobacterium terramassiliense]|uniref:HNH endonuclease n=1 Tax=Mycobacterium terramassiliense TaxID=1841859 RepID=UPI0012FFC102|nr:HNH endonuclease signature motif containing protein [Mycobacterium terramassiliense]